MVYKLDFGNIYHLSEIPHHVSTLSVVPAKAHTIFFQMSQLQWHQFLVKLSLFTMDVSGAKNYQETKLVLLSGAPCIYAVYGCKINLNL